MAWTTVGLHGHATLAGPASTQLDRLLGPFPAPDPADVVLQPGPVPHRAPASHAALMDLGGGIPRLTDGWGRAAEVDVAGWVGPSTTIRYEEGFDPRVLYSRVVLPALRVRLALRASLATLRASCFQLDGLTVAVAGASGSGKTSLLLDALGRGATFLADNWLLADGDGRVWPLSTRVHLPDHRLLRDPVLRRRLPPRLRAGLVARAAGRGALDGVSRACPAGSTLRHAVRWAADAPSATAWARVGVQELFPDVHVPAGATLSALVIATGRPDAESLASLTRSELARDLEWLLHGASFGAATLLREAGLAEIRALRRLLSATPHATAGPGGSLDDVLDAARDAAHRPRTTRRAHLHLVGRTRAVRVG